MRWRRLGRGEEAEKRNGRKEGNRQRRVRNGREESGWCEREKGGRRD